MSQHVPPDAEAFQELEALVRALGEELARFRRRAMAAEALLKQQQTVAEAQGGAVYSSDRLAVLEAENAQLRERLTLAAERTTSMMDRLRFLRQQTQAGDVA